MYLEDDRSIPDSSYAYPFLSEFLAEHGEESNLTIPLIRGYFFGVISATTFIEPEVWLPHLLQSCNTTLAEAGDGVFGDIAALFRSMAPAAAAGCWSLPKGVHFNSDSDANLNPSSPIAQWSLGFRLIYESGHLTGNRTATHRSRLTANYIAGAKQSQPDLMQKAAEVLLFFGAPNVLLDRIDPAKRQILVSPLTVYCQTCFVDAMNDYAEEAFMARSVRTPDHRFAGAIGHPSWNADVTSQIREPADTPTAHEGRSAGSSC